MTESISAGHPPALMGTPAGDVRPLNSGATLPLGIEPVEPRAQWDAISPAQTLMLYSDGWTDLPCGHNKLLGVHGLTECWRSVCRDSRDATLDHTLSLLQTRVASLQNGSPAFDDRTLLLVRRPG